MTSTPLIAPIEAYQQRAGNGGPSSAELRALLVPTPSAAELDRLVYGTVSTATRTVWADISSWQKPVTDAYTEPMLAFRADSGGSTDPNARANWAWCERTERLRVALAYVVGIPGQEQAIVARLRNLFGATPDAVKLALMLDAESGGGFAGPGNHSASFNKLDELVSLWLGDEDRVVGYANAPDWASVWPTRRANLKRVTANYGTTWPGTWAQQYYGGMNYPTPAGLPRTMAPFGTNVDLNVAHASIDTLVTQLGLGDSMTPAQVQAACLAALTSPAGQAVIRTAVRPYFVGSDGGAKNVESIVSHVTQGANYASRKGINWPALARAAARAVAPDASDAEVEAHADALAEVLAADDKLLAGDA